MSSGNVSDDRAKHSIAFPDVPKFRRLWSELLAMVKERLQLSALFASRALCILKSEPNEFLYQASVLLQAIPVQAHSVAAPLIVVA
jgi:hypothetical protein